MFKQILVCILCRNEVFSKIEKRYKQKFTHDKCRVKQGNNSNNRLVWKQNSKTKNLRAGKLQAEAQFKETSVVMLRID